MAGFDLEFDFRRCAVPASATLAREELAFWPVFLACAIPVVQALKHTPG